MAVATACQDAVSVPSLRVVDTDEGVAGGVVGCGGVKGPAGEELRHPLQPWSFPARTATM